MVEEELKSTCDLELHMHCCSYPALRPYMLEPSHLEGSAKAAYLAKLLPELIGNGHRALIFSQWTRCEDAIPTCAPCRLSRDPACRG
eukprot:2553821-Prymnesium_polylepis.2